MISKSFAETTTALAGAAVYTGPARGAGADGTQGRFTQFSATVFADQAGTLSVQWSADGSTNWTKAAADQAVTASVPATVTVNVLAPFFRVVYTNGALANTVCRIRSGFLG